MGDFRRIKFEPGPKTRRDDNEEFRDSKAPRRETQEDLIATIRRQYAEQQLQEQQRDKKVLQPSRVMTELLKKNKKAKLEDDVPLQIKESESKRRRKAEEARKEKISY